jgi:hypothetical protein
MMERREDSDDQKRQGYSENPYKPLNKWGELFQETPRNRILPNKRSEQHMFSQGKSDETSSANLSL